MNVDLQKVGGAIAAELIPGWTVHWVPVTKEQIDKLVPGALAVCRSHAGTIPERSIAKVFVVSPWPAEENLATTLWHELTHAALSPITSQLDDSPGGVMLEEQIVERFGKLFARVPMMARRAMQSAIDLIAKVSGAPSRVAVVRARISARGERARIGDNMDPDQIKAAISALKEGNGEGALGILEALLIAAASGGTAPSMEAPPESADAPVLDAPSDTMGREGAPPPPPADETEEDEMARKVARKGAPRLAARKGAPIVNEQPKEDTGVLRARKAAQDSADELAAMAKAQRPMALETLVVGLRARLGDRFTPAAEKKIMGAPSFQKAQELADFAESMGGGDGAQRARSGAELRANPGAGSNTIPVEELIAEGHGLSWINGYQSTAKKDPNAGAVYLETGREMLRARKAANGAGRVS